MSRKTTKANKTPNCSPIHLTAKQLGQLEKGNLAYIRDYTPKAARRAFPQIEGIPKTGHYWALYGADGTPIALTDNYEGVLGHARSENLECGRVN